ncbi:hypothetical protein [Lewinella sp. LCG006]|uniref:hypothetical protein n=1 Tax=Lewinella sp. LCG006 TaxID=3231911 RepID=UPI0034611943
MTASSAKSTLLFLAFSLFSTFSFSQVISMQTTGFAYQYMVDNYNWSNWTDFEPTQMPIVIDIDHEQIVIYSAETQIYNVMKAEGSSYDQDGDEFLSFYCVNEDGIACRIRLAMLNSQGGRYQFYVDFDDMRWVYNVYIVE